MTRQLIRRSTVVRLNKLACVCTAIVLFIGIDVVGQEVRVEVDASQVVQRVSPLMTGACIEDVNHEIYGGIYSQLIFGESFQESVATRSPIGFQHYGDPWSIEGDFVRGLKSNGNKLVSQFPPFEDGIAEVQVRFDGDSSGLAGLILRVAEPAVGADNFVGYEVSLDPGHQVLLLGRHRQNWEPIRSVPCEVLKGEWNRLRVELDGNRMVVHVNGKEAAEYIDNEHPLAGGAIGLRTWQRDTLFRGLAVTTEGKRSELPIRPAPAEWSDGVSGMWQGVRSGTAEGRFQTPHDQPFAGSQSQEIRFEKGLGSFGIANGGLKKWGIHWRQGKPYRGRLVAQAAEDTKVTVSLESFDGERTLAGRELSIHKGEWRTVEFELTPDSDEPKGRFAVQLKEPGTVRLGYVFVEPGPWGLFHDLPVRKDVAEGLTAGNIRVLRMGGLMANAPEYRWKKMLGPRERRAPYQGYWYPQSTNGWGIMEFMQFCEAARFLPIPDVNLDESPEDLADLVEYFNGAADTKHGAERVADGHAKPYGLKYLEIGNEEAVDEKYWLRFRPIAEAVWASDPNLVLIVGDFEYREPIRDPLNFKGAPRIQSLAAHKKILDLAAEHGREVWFDIHIWNHDLHDCDKYLAALPTYIDALQSLSPKAQFKVCVLEENSVNHRLRRSLAHARTLQGLMRLSERVPIVCAANCLQPDGQNDNGWDQGLLFLNPSRVWAQPPLWVSRMIADHHQPNLVALKTPDGVSELDIAALVSDDRRRASLQIVNSSDKEQSIRLDWKQNGKALRLTRVTRIAGDLEMSNTAERPDRVVPWTQIPDADNAPRTDSEVMLSLPAYSFSCYLWERE
ncbi:MAG: alpha-L-arabinofuranosidase C-terminal domain-containing protein [Pirellulales bacterium]